jgi:hypothetical protein
MSWALAGFATGDVAGGPGTGDFGRGEAGDTGAPEVGRGSGLAGAAGRLGGVGRADTRGAPSAPAGADDGEATNVARKRRATGASTVLDADLTNSPISLSLASTILLSTPSSLASS